MIARPRDPAERSDVELRAALAADDPSGRLSAAWALAERVGRSSGRDLAPERISHGDDPTSARKQLLGVLSMRGENDVLAVIARLDPDPRIRGGASAGLARRAAVDANSAAHVVERLLGETDAGARRALVDALPDVVPHALFASVSTLLLHPDVELRRAALGRLLAWSGHELPAPLDVHAFREPDPTLRGQLIDAWLARRGPSALLQAAGEAPVAWIADVLARIRPGDVAWSAIDPIAGRQLAMFDPLLLPHATDGDDPAVRRYLVALVARAVDPSSKAYLVEASMARSLVATALGRLEPTLLEPPGAEPTLAPLLESIARVLARAEVERLDGPERVLIQYAPRVRYRLAAPDPRGWYGAALHVRHGGKPRTLIEHSADDAHSSVILSATSGLELRASAHALAAIGAALPEASIARALRGLSSGVLHPELDAQGLEAALVRAVPPHPELAQDLVQIARIASARGSALRVEFVEGWWDPTVESPDRPTLAEPEDD